MRFATHPVRQTLRHVANGGEMPTPADLAEIPGADKDKKFANAIVGAAQKVREALTGQPFDKPGALSTGKRLDSTPRKPRGGTVRHHGAARRLADELAAGLIEYGERTHGGEPSKPSAVDAAGLPPRNFI